jgi:hypothetical protein
MNTKIRISFSILLASTLLHAISGFVPPSSGPRTLHVASPSSRLFLTPDKEATKNSSPNTPNTPKQQQRQQQIPEGATPEYLNQESFGGYTVKQRLREEVESPFRKVRLFFFGSSVASAMTALYFSALSTLKASMGGYADAPPLDEALASDAINLGAVVVCAFFAYREYEAGKVNLERIARGGKLAALVVQPSSGGRLKLAEYRRGYRVLIAAGGASYISKLARSLCADQLSDINSLPEKLIDSDVIVVPVLLSESNQVQDTKAFWNNVQAEEGDRNLDISRANELVSFPTGANKMWTEYLQSELTTAKGQGFDVLETGITLIVKKNGRILRRATGLPPWGDLIDNLEVMDGSRFGMPGDSKKYGGS